MNSAYIIAIAAIVAMVVISILMKSDKDSPDTSGKKPEIRSSMRTSEDAREDSLPKGFSWSEDSASAHVKSGSGDSASASGAGTSADRPKSGMKTGKQINRKIVRQYVTYFSLEEDRTRVKCPRCGTENSRSDASCCVCGERLRAG